jgi:hypothetical protein
VKDDLIFKEGDYGISVYQIVAGKVALCKDTESGQIELATLGPGAVLGDSHCLDNTDAARFESARALEDCEIEVWHPAGLAEEYEKMPLILRHVLAQLGHRLERMNKHVVKRLADKTPQMPRRQPEEPGIEKRRHYRKPADQKCTYRPVGAEQNFRFMGQIRDFSLSGIGMTVSAKNALSASHEPGDEFQINTVFPSGKVMDVRAKIMSAKKDETPGRLFVGLEIAEMDDESRKNLGFFLMA